MIQLASALIMAARKRKGDVLVYESAITSGALKIATRDGEAMFFHDSIDFGAYAGTDSGNTPYKIVFTDSTGKVAEAWGGGKGGGETLGSDLLSGWDFTTWSQYSSPKSVGTNNFVSTADGLCGVFKYGNFPTGSIYKLDVSGSNSGTGQVEFTETSTDRFGLGFGTHYHTQFKENGFLIRTVGNIDNGVVTITQMIVKKLTDIPATGLHLTSAKNSTTRNMASVESGFNPNTVTNVKIYR